MYVYIRVCVFGVCIRKKNHIVSYSQAQIAAISFSAQARETQSKGSINQSVAMIIRRGDFARPWVNQTNRPSKIHRRHGSSSQNQQNMENRHGFFPHRQFRRRLSHRPRERLHEQWRRFPTTQKSMQRQGDTSPQRQRILNFHAFRFSLTLFLNFEFSATYDRACWRNLGLLLVFLLGYDEMMMQCVAIAPRDEKRGIVVQDV